MVVCAIAQKVSKYQCLHAHIEVYPMRSHDSVWHRERGEKVMRHQLFICGTITKILIFFSINLRLLAQCVCTTVYETVRVWMA